MKQLVLLGLVASLALSACKKKDPEASLPAATQVGANTAGCLINGQAFVAAGWGGSLLTNPIPPLGGGFFYDSLYYLRINGLYNGHNSILSLFFRSQSLGIYQLNKNTPTLLQGGLSPVVLNHASLSIDDGNEIFITDEKHTGTTTLSVASRNTGISAGTFEFTAASQTDPSKTVTITNGRFDRKQ